MSKVAIITDSVSCIPEELVDEYDIRIVPVNVIIDGKSYRDGVDITATELYTQLKHLKKVPTTSTPSAGQFLELYGELSAQTANILVITVSAGLSAVFSAANQAVQMAKETLPEINIQVIDSKTAAGAEGFVVIEAARMAAHGSDLTNVVMSAKNMVKRVHMLGMLDTLHYLTKTRTKRKGVDLLVSLMRERVGDEKLHLNIQHANALDDAKHLLERIEGDFDCAEVYITDFTPVMGAATGPGVLCLSFYSGN